MDVVRAQRIISSTQPLVPCFGDELPPGSEFVLAYEWSLIVKHQVMLSKTVIPVGILQRLAHVPGNAAFGHQCVQLTNVIGVKNDVRVGTGILKDLQRLLKLSRIG